jgi:hypothetical protein
MSAQPPWKVSLIGGRKNAPSIKAFAKYYNLMKEKNA